MRREELRQEANWRRCRGKGPTDAKACAHFLKTYFKIKHPEQGRIPFDLRPAQLETLDIWLTQRYSIVLKARQIGFSTLAAGMALWLCLYHADKFLVMLSRTERDAIKLLQKAAYGYRYLPEWMKARGPKLLTDNQLKMVFDNESSIESLPSQNDPARGESVYLIFVDEWAFLDNPEEAWASIEPVADVGGRVIGLSTANGAGNFYHQFWTKARSGTSRFVPIFYPWSANTDRGETWYESKAEDLGATPWILHQEYPRNEEEAFIKSGNPVFDTDALDQIDPRTPRTGYLIDVRQYHMGKPIVEFREQDKGPLRIYAAPVPGDRYCIGADVAEGLEHGDYSSAHVKDVRSGEVVAVWHGHVDPDLFGSDVLNCLGSFYNAALIGVEVNNHGLTTATALMREMYPNLYYRTTVDERTNKTSRKVGFRTQSNTKPLIVDELARSLRDQTTVVRDEPTIYELKTFVREGDGKMHGSPYDDRTMSLAICNYMTQFVYVEEYEPQSNDEWTLGWWAESTKPTNDEWLIGV